MSRPSLDPLIACLDDINCSFLRLFENQTKDLPSLHIETERHLVDAEKLVRRVFRSVQIEHAFDVTTTECLDLESGPSDVALRFASSAFAARFSVPPAPDVIGRSLYAKAFKIVMATCVDKPSLSVLQALLLTAACAFSFGNAGAFISLTGVAIRVVEFITTIENSNKHPTQIFNHDQALQMTWIKCLDMCSLLNAGFSVLKYRLKFIETSSHIEDVILTWSKLPFPPPYISIFSSIANIHGKIQSHPPPTTPNELISTVAKIDFAYKRMGRCVMHLPRWYCMESVIRLKSMDCALGSNTCSIHSPSSSKDLAGGRWSRHKYSDKVAGILGAIKMIVYIGGRMQELDKRKWTVECLYSNAIYFAGKVFGDLMGLARKEDVRKEMWRGVVECIALLEEVLVVSPIVERMILDLKGVAKGTEA
ncbi:hypothetical protein HDU97_005677 [Phlyctochytrium planicorne]|nr:hypothetical protein HDU97_005677 [Phlyctochytrium planicorne]